MKRAFIIGVIGFAAVAILLIGGLLGVLVTPARAQLERALDQAVERAQSVVTNLLESTTTRASAQAAGVQLKDEKGILVGGVFQGSPADKAGLVRGNIILEADGQAVNNVSDLTSILSQRQSGDTLSLRVQHGDALKTVSVTLAEQPGAAAAQDNQPNEQPNRRKGLQQSGPYLGIIPIGAEPFKSKVEKSTQQAGARITQVSAGSPAEQAGLKTGEIITAVDGTAVDAQNSLGALITARKPGDSVTLAVRGTDGAEREVKVTLADHPQQAGTAYLGVSTGGFGRGRGFEFPGLPEGSQPQMPMPHNFPGFGPGIIDHPGAMLQQVTSGSPAEKAGLEPGQIIEAVDGQKLGSAQSLADAVAARKPGETVTLSVYDPQAGQSSEVKVTLGENPDKPGAAWLGIQFGFSDFQNMPMPQKTPGADGTQF